MTLTVVVRVTDPPTPVITTKYVPGVLPLQFKVAVCEPETVEGSRLQLTPSGLDEDSVTGPANPFVPLKLMISATELPAVKETLLGAEMVNSGGGITEIVMSTL